MKHKKVKKLTPAQEIELLRIQNERLRQERVNLILALDALRASKFRNWG